MGVKARKQKEIDIKRKDIIDAAERVFFEKGFHHVTMDDVAKEAEFSKRTIYVYFRSKDQLYFEIMLRGYKLLNSIFAEEIGEGSQEKGIEKIKSLGKTIVDFNNSYPDYFKAIMDYENGDIDFENDHATVKECYDQGEILLHHLKNALKEGVEEGSILASIDVTNTALVLWASIVGVLNMSRRKEKYLIHYHKRTASDLVAEAFKLLFRSIEK